MRRSTESSPPWHRLAALAPLLVAFFYIPLAFGGTTPLTSLVFDWLLFYGFSFWLCVLVLERRLPRMSWYLAVPLVFLVLVGLGHFFNARSYFDPVDWRFLPREDHLSGLPGSVDAATSLPFLRHMAAMLLAGLALRDALAGSRVRWLVFRVVALSGLVIATIGIYQKASNAGMMLWGIPLEYERSFFAAFRYHANAASFLNLSWPAALAVWLRSRMMRPGSIVSSLDFCVFFLTLAAVFVNTSKAGQILGLLAVGLAAWRFRRELLIPVTSRAGGIVLGVFVAGIVLVLVFPAVYLSFSKWSQLVEHGGSFKGRIMAYGACLEAIREAGLFGNGAGTFSIVFPIYTLDLGEDFYGFWRFAHQDWLQGIIEWGWLGFAAWAAIFSGALFRLGRRAREARKDDQPEITSSIALLALGIVLLHALVDFPFQIPAIQWLVVFYLALAWSRPYDPRTKDQGPGV